MTVPMTNVATNGMSVLAAGAAGRRRFSEEDKRRIVDEASQPGGQHTCVGIGRQQRFGHQRGGIDQGTSLF
jgi:transposase-like protein